MNHKSKDDLSKKAYEAFQRVFYGFLVSGAVIGFTFQGLIKYINPSTFACGGILLVLSIVATYGYNVFGSRRLTVAYISGAFSFAFFFISIAHAQKFARKNDEYCLKIQRDIYKDGKYDESAATAFSSLSCRPQYFEKHNESIGPFSVMNRVDLFLSTF